MVYVPCADVTALRCCPVSRFDTVTCAATSGAPPAPVTRPCRLTVFCASRPAAPPSSPPAASSTVRSRWASGENIGRSSSSKEPVRSAPATPPELQYVSPAGRQLQRDRHDTARELTERTAPVLIDPLDLPAAPETVGGRVEGERDGRRLVDDACQRDRDAPLLGAPRAGDRRRVPRCRHGRPP